MSKLLLLPLFFLLACAGEPPKTPDSVGEVKRFEPLMVTFEDNERIQAICRALSSKEDLLSILVSTGSEYNFTYTQKGCGDQQLPTPKTVVATLQKTDSSYVFKPKYGETFGFPDVETYSKGVMKDICQNVGSLMSPMQTSRTGAIWFTSFTSTNHCISDATGICIHIQRGTSSESANYKIHTNEWIKFRVNNDRRGFIVERKLVSSADCPPYKTVEKRAVLK
jgi:hypothetical protein